MTVTAITSVTADRAEYSRYETSTPDGDRSRLILTARGVADDGDAAFFCVRNRRTQRPVAHKAAAWSGNVATASIDLDHECNDADGIYRAAHGTYVATCEDTDARLTLPAHVAIGDPFRIVVLTSAQLATDHLFGVALDGQRLAPAVEGLPGVTGTDARAVQWGGYPLRYEYGTAPTISFNNGPAHTIRATPAYTQRLWQETLDGYIEVRIDPTQLPTASADAYVLMDYERLTDAALQGFLDESYSAWNAVLASTTIEPTQVATPRIAARFPYADRADWNAESWDRPRSPSRGPEIVLGARRVLAVHALSGFYNTTDVLTIDPSWRVLDTYNGVINFVPTANARMPTTPIAAGIYGGIMGSGFLADHVEEFWQFAFSYGLNDLWDAKGAQLRAGIGMSAAIRALLVAGRAAQGALASESFSRDGVSVSRNYTTGQMGLYSDRIAGLQAWLDKNQAIVRRMVIGIPGRA